MSDLSAIKAGLDNGEFFLEYLPTVSLDTNRCIGGEALIRWRQDARVVPPQEFLPSLENTPMAERLTHWVIDTVAHELGGWLRDHDHELMHISINVPPEVFVHDRVEHAVTRSKLNDVAHKLVFEVTACSTAEKLDVNTLDGKEKSIVLVALDDVGAKNTDMVVLARARVDIVKIDKSFVDQMLQPDWSQEKLSRLETLINGSSLAAIAEGVETQQQADILRAAGVKMAQGWYFSRPLSAADFRAYFDSHQQ